MIKMRKAHLGWILVLSITLWLVACGDEDDKTKKPQLTIITAEMKASVTKLYYKGSLQPIKNVPVLSPVDGTITALHFNYGETIKKDQNLAIISSDKLANDYREAVSKYLQAKDTYETTLQSFGGTTALYKAGLIPTEQFMTSKSQFETNTLNFYQSKYDLEKILKKSGVSAEKIESLTITDTAEVAQILQKKFDNIEVLASGSGVALFPAGGQSSDDGGGGSKNGKLTIGSQVKEGQLILSIGDLTGFSVTLQVSEININRIKAGLPVIATGYAFPGIVLHGTVTGVAKQANPSQDGMGGSLSMFNIEVQIPHLTPEEQQTIHVGMTADFEIDIKNPPAIAIPINAVFQKDGLNYVTIIDPKTNKQTDVPVETGTTGVTDVTILKGLKAGDKVVVHD